MDKGRSDCVVVMVHCCCVVQCCVCDVLFVVGCSSAHHVVWCSVFEYCCVVIRCGACVMCVVCSAVLLLHGVSV